MAVPKKKLSKSRRGMRRSHDAITASNVYYCANCGHPMLSHTICSKCGTYFQKKAQVSKK